MCIYYLILKKKVHIVISHINFTYLFLTVFVSDTLVVYRDGSKIPGTPGEKYTNSNTNVNDRSPTFTCHELLRLRGRMVGESIITARKRSLGQGNVFTHVSHSIEGGFASQHASQAT